MTSRAGSALIEAGGRTLPLIARRNPRAKRIVLRIAPGADRLLLTLPPGATLADGLKLAERSRDWLSARLARLSPPVAFAAGALIPLRGRAQPIRYDAARPRGVALTAEGLVIGGAPDRLAPTLSRWLRSEAGTEFEACSRQLADRLGRPLGRVRVREMRTRWGSCSPRGDISYAWRLILAPDAVRAYVAAHEVAHLACRSHDDRFWATVGGLQPAADTATARAWLSAHGASLFRYG